MRRSAAPALAVPALALAAAAACQCAGPGGDLFDCRAPGSDCAYCDRDGRCVILLDGGFSADAGPPDAGPPDGGRFDGGPTACEPFLGNRICSPDGVCWEHPLPQGNELTGVWGSGPSSVWAVGAAGTVLHWDGSAWSRIESGTRAGLLSVWTDLAGEAWVTGESGQWFRVTRQGGRAATASGVPPGVDLTDLWGDSSPGGWALWATGYGGKVYRADRTQASPAAADLSSLNPTSDRYALFGVPGGAKVWTVGQGGAVWSHDAVTTLPGSVAGLPHDAFDVWMASGTELWISTREAGVYTGTGDGTWTPQPVSSTSPIASAIWGDAASGELWVRGYDGLSYHRSPAGQWSSRQDPGRLNVRDVWGSAGEVWAVGEKGYLARWDAGAGAWDPYSVGLFPPRPSGADLVAIQSLGCEVWAVGRNGQLLRRTDSGWSQFARASGAVTSLWAAGPGEVWFGTGQGRADRTMGAPDGGYDTEIGGAVLGLSGSSSNDLWAVGEDGGISHWDGLSWTRQASPQQVNLNAVHARAPDDVWAVGDFRTVLHFDGGSWSTAVPPDPAGPHLRAIAASGSRLLAAGGTSLYVHDATGWNSRADAPRALRAVTADGQGRIWVAGDRGLLMFLPPGGGNWVTVDVPTGGDLHALSYRNGELLIAGEDNAILDVHPGP